MNPAYGTHLSPLLAAVHRTSGPVLELGAGFWSTPALHQLCGPDRHLLSVDSDPGWVAKFSLLACAWHKLITLSDWSKLSNCIGSQHWSVILIDHAPGSRRVIDIAQLRRVADVMVVHDTEDGSYGYERILPSFKYRSRHKQKVPWTDTVSDTVDVLRWVAA